MINKDFFRMWLRTFDREIKSRVLKPINSIAFITYRCTSRCTTCNIWQRSQGRIEDIKKSELSNQSWIDVIKKLHLADVSTIEIFGGDALLRKDIVFPIIEKSKELNIETFFPTNSNLLDQNTGRDLVLSGLGTIYFSVDGIEDLHNKIRGVKRNYKNVEEAIWNVHNVKNEYGYKDPKMGIITTLSNMNVNEIEAIISEFRKYPIDFVYLRGMGEITQEDIDNSIIDGIKASPFFISTSGESHLLSETQVHYLRSVLKRLHKNKHDWPFYLGLSAPLALKDESYTKGVYPDFLCHMCTTVVTLTPSGEVAPCPFFTDFILGKLNEEKSLLSIWGNDRHRRFVKKQRNGDFSICRKCCMRYLYPGLRETSRHVFYPYIFGSFIGDK